MSGPKLPHLRVIDRASRAERLAIGKPRVCIEQPSWTKELLTVGAVVAAVGFSVMAAQAVGHVDDARAARAEAAYWKSRAHGVDTAPAVRLDPSNLGYRCTHMNVRREWESAVAAECQVMASLLTMARATK